MNLVQASIVLIVYTFIVFVAYITLSTPILNVFTEFEDINLSASDSDVETVSTIVRSVFDMVFGMALFIPITYFVVWCFHREPDWRYEK